MNTHTRRRDLLLVLLTLVTGATDAIGFVGLGGVFTSVMTGNMVLVGVAIGKGSGVLAEHTGVAFAGYVLGSIAGAHIVRDLVPRRHHWPSAFQGALIVELAVFACFVVGWEVAGAHPHGDVTFALLGINAIALGIQSSAVQGLGIPGLSTTYLTGTLTTFVGSLTKRTARSGSALSAVILSALIAGAAAGAAATVHAPRFAPFVPFGLLALVLGTGALVFRGAPPAEED